MQLCGFDVGLNRPFFLIAGTCSIESLQMSLDVAGQLKEVCSALDIPLIYKGSFDKANRSSLNSFRGPGLEKGIEWLGEVPEHWEVQRLKNVANVLLGKMLTTEAKAGDGDFKPYLRSTNVQWIKPDVRDVKEMWVAKAEMAQLRVRKGDLLVSEGGEVGRACMWNDELPECYIQNSVHRVAAKPMMLPEFLFHQFFTYGKRGRFNAIVNRVSIAHLTREKLVTIPFTVPPIEEQKAICRWISDECQPLDDAIARTEEEIKLIREYRDRLIADVVTGQVDVRGWQPGPDDVVDDAALAALGDAVITTDAEGVVNYINPVAIGLLGTTKHSYVGKPIKQALQFYSMDSSFTSEGLLQQLLSTEVAVRDDQTHWVRRVDQSIVPVKVMGSTIVRDGQMAGAVFVLRDVSREQQYMDQISWNARHDTLTGLPNRLSLRERLGAALARSRTSIPVRSRIRGLPSSAFCAGTPKERRAWPYASPVS